MVSVAGHAFAVPLVGAIVVTKSDASVGQRPKVVTASSFHSSPSARMPNRLNRRTASFAPRLNGRLVSSTTSKPPGAMMVPGAKTSLWRTSLFVMAHPETSTATRVALTNSTYSLADPWLDSTSLILMFGALTTVMICAPVRCASVVPVMRAVPGAIPRMAPVVGLTPAIVGSLDVHVTVPVEMGSPYGSPPPAVAAVATVISPTSITDAPSVTVIVADVGGAGWVESEPPQ